MVEIEMISEKDMYDYFKRMVSDTSLSLFAKQDNQATECCFETEND